MSTEHPFNNEKFADERKERMFCEYCNATGLQIETRDAYPPTELDIEFAMIRRRAKFAEFYEQRQRIARGEIVDPWRSDAGKHRA